MLSKIKVSLVFIALNGYVLLKFELLQTCSVVALLLSAGIFEACRVLELSTSADNLNLGENCPTE